jgi:hypothetical protein
MFPASGILDDFNRANEGPPPSANWTGFVGLSQGDNLEVISNQLGTTTTDASAWWNVSTFGPDCEVYCTLPVVSGANVYLYARGANPGTGTLDAYLVFWSSGGNVFTYRIDNDILTQLGTQVALSLAANDKLGLEVVGDDLTIYADTAGSWTSRDAHVDATYSAAGFIAIGTNNTASRFDDFGGGTVVAASTDVMLVMGMLGTGRI